LAPWALTVMADGGFVIFAQRALDNAISKEKSPRGIEPPHFLVNFGCAGAILRVDSGGGGAVRGQADRLRTAHIHRRSHNQMKPTRPNTALQYGRNQ
jgi:hypothetical protein